MELVILCVAALVTSLLTFFTGFGLGTILTPVFAIFFPIEISIALTGVVHFLNNIFKFTLVGHHADKRIVLRFGIPAFVFAFFGAFVLLKITGLGPLYAYTLMGKEFVITPVKAVVSVLLIIFALMESIPVLKNIQFGNNLVLGGILSGFFGGLSGNQGALRSAFLVKTGLSKESFIATGIVIACLVDFSRLGVYLSRFSASGLQENLTLVIAATLSAFVGAFAGSRLLKKITLETVQVVVTVMLIILSIAIGLGLV
ncbi:TSUP family transporter [Fulvivirgaceae bacterium PWU4]|uniref:Probable membrane transporter protein n=1 Tax=Chryseosolibacter histidini TaxID=2782349 RepID=A0AAP2GM73_9BACT|nr:TSUP family transporter [Chryseosolibacter histidini]MBT1695392.1 TSUP family transporter [Chryseosolibacter histidini]